ncbi:MAG: guanylate kinase [Hyphomicrobiales bacterium]
MSNSASRQRQQKITPPEIARRGLLFVLSSPSGAGKTTIARRLLARDAQITMSVSVTTRAPRPGEQAGIDYHFITREKFRAMIDRNELLEYAEVFGNLYGTPRAPVEQAMAQGRDVLFDIDWQGTQQLSEALRDDVVRVFVLPPTAEALRERLINRAQDSASVVAKRMAEASREISHWPEYDYVIINTDIDDSDRAIDSILVAERLKRHRRVGLTEFVRGLVKTL